MSWTLFGFALAGVFLAQTVILPLLPFTSAIDLFLTCALVCGLVLPVPEARLAGWITGFTQDVHSTYPFGLHAFMLGLVVLVLTQLRELVNLQLWWARWVIAFAVALPAQLLIRIYLRFMLIEPPSWVSLLTGAALSAAIAAVLTAFVLGLPGVLRRSRRRQLAMRW